MECSCAIDVDYSDCDSVDFYTVDVRKAVKIHRCTSCHRYIKKGEEYEIVKFKLEGSFFTDKTCWDCLSARKQFFPRGGHYDMWEEIREEIDNSDAYVPESCVAKLAPVARAKVCDFIQDFWDNVDERLPWS